MASTIKGITVKIAGETTDLQKALKNIQSSSRSLQSELKTINNQLKFDPDNTVLLAQKQDVLREQIDNSTDALKQLLDVEEQVKDQAKNGEISTDQYRAFQREVEKAKSQLENFKKQLEETEAAAKSVNMKPLVDEMSNVKSETDKAGDSFKELEGKSKNTDLSKFKKELDDVKESTSKLKTTINETATELFTSAGVIGGAAVTAITSANSEKKALNSLQVQTGLTSSELMDYKSVINDIYTDNFGESQEEIADTLAKIKQLTGETDPTKLKNMAENLYTLQDSFEGFDIGETLRGVNGLVTNMGLSAEEAFDYIVKGAQNGLNYSGELADNMAEYSQIWGQAGFSAEQAFSILENGTKSGAYNLDKVNDFVKEFTISLADGRIEENLGSFSDDTAELFNKWKDGKATAADVFYSVINDLKNAKNDQEALTTASNVWSALGEDNALKVITSLGNVNDSYKNVQGSMEKIKDIKYDDVESDWESLGRKIKTDVINPIGKSLFPDVKKLCDFTSKNINKIIPTLKTVGSLTAGIWIGKKTSAVITATTQLVSSYKTLKTATESAKIAQEGLNLAQKANVIGAVVSIATTLIGTMYAWSEATNDNARELDEWQEELDNAKQKNDELTESYDNFITKRDEAVSKAQSENEYYEKLWGELKSIVDENGKVIEGYEDRAKFIATELNEKLGTEIELNGGVVQSYKDVKGAIEDLIKYKKANNILSAYEPSYQEAIQNKSTQLGIVAETESEYNEKKEATSDIEKKIRAQYALIDKYKEQQKSASRDFDPKLKSSEWNILQGKIINSKSEINGLKNELEIAKAAEAQRKDNFEQAKKTYSTYLSAIENYESLETAIINENADDTEDALLRIQNNFVTAKNGTKEVLQEQLDDYTTKFNKIREAIASGKTDYYTEEDLANMQKLMWLAQNELDAFLQDTENSGQEVSNSYGKGIEENSDVVKQSATKAAKKGTSGTDEVKGDFFSKGEVATSLYSSGMLESNEKVRRAGINVAYQARDGVGSVSIFSIGNNFVQGFINGISDGDAIKNVWSVASGVGGLALSAVKKILGINSPSKEAKKLGSYFTEGLSLGISSNKNKVKSSTESIAQILLDNFDLPEFDFDFRTINDKFNNIRDLDSAVSNSVNKTVTNSPTVKLNFGDVIINNDTDIDRFNERVSAAVIDALGKEY